MGDSSGRNVVLTGFMGTGKTTVGRALADRLGFEFVDTDAVIEERHGPIPALFEREGEDRFRELERELAGELAATTRTVISTGGRMLVDEVNAARLGATGDVVCLTASVETILRRLGGEAAAASRPMLRGGDVDARVRRLLAERAPAYARFVAVGTDDRAPDDVVAEIVAVLAELHGSAPPR
jgi:shikimate kinase